LGKQDVFAPKDGENEEQTSKNHQKDKNGEKETIDKWK
jgi:hypothetical protein